MQLKEFLENFIEHNSVVRLVYKDKSGHRIVHDSWNDVSMEHQILKGKGKDRYYINSKVLGICSILVHGAFPEAINIVIEELETQLTIDEVHQEKSFELQGGGYKKINFTIINYKDNEPLFYRHGIY